MVTNESVPQKFVVQIGPQHPALKEPGHFEFTVDGEIVTNAAIRLGFVHRGIEKAAESRSYIQDLYLFERICGICSGIHSIVFSLGVEKLANVTVPPRAQYIRTIIAELERIHSHMLWLGVAAHEGGFDTLFMFSWRDRETVMDILEGITGNRVNYSANILGGVKCDISEKQIDQVRRGIDFLEERTKYYMKVVTTDETFLGRTRGVGTIPRLQAEALGTVGPTARASGVPDDIRADSPYLVYAEHPIKRQVAEAGDLEARFVVRLNELFDSYRLVRELLDHLPVGELTTRMPRRIPEGETITRVEAPRGELFYYIKSNGTDTPERVKVRTPSLCNWSAITAVAVGHKLADMPMLLVSIDPCFSCNDRMVVIQDKSEAHTWSWEELRRYGIERYK
jgi:ech hydrogenase subunit E